MSSRDSRHRRGTEPEGPLAILVEPNRAFRHHAFRYLLALECEVYDFGDVPDLIGFLPLVATGRRPDFLLLCAESAREAEELRTRLDAMPILHGLPMMTYLAHEVADPVALLERIAGMVHAANARRNRRAARRQAQVGSA